MSARIDPDDRIGTFEAAVHENLRRWLDGPNDLDDARAEVVRHFLTHPEAHRRDVAAITEKKYTYRELAQELERTSPRAWSYPADEWAVVDRIAELRARTVLSGEEPIVAALEASGRSPAEIAAMLSLAESTVEATLHGVQRSLDDARATVELLGDRREEAAAR